MERISDNFNREEFACKCGCGFDTVDTVTLKVMQAIRIYFGKPVRVTSGCRCKEHNAKIGGVKNSRHMLGKACDFQIKGVSPVEITAFIDKRYGDRFSVGTYKTFNHIDSQGYKRWNGNY